MNIRAEIEICAAPERVWDILTRFEDYKSWNPFIPDASGEAVEGRAIRVFIRPPGSKGMQFRPLLLTVAPGRLMRWRGSVGMPGLFDGEHVFRITPLGPNRVRLEQDETFKGLLAPILASRSFLDSAVRGFEAMNEALRVRAETDR